jgi:hypothetical protein
MAYAKTRGTVGLLSLFTWPRHPTSPRAVLPGKAVATLALGKPVIMDTGKGRSSQEREAALGIGCF